MTNDAAPDSDVVNTGTRVLIKRMSMQTDVQQYFCGKSMNQMCGMASR